MSINMRCSRIFPFPFPFLALSLSLALAACGSATEGDDDDDDDDDVVGQPDAGPGTPDADLTDLDWQPLITGNWTLAPGGEDTGNNHQVVLDRDIYVGAIRPIEPVGTHHTVLGHSASTAGLIYASGVGTNAVVFPEGVGLKFPKGATVTLSLHIYNTSDSPLSGLSGIEIVEIAAEDVVHEADLYLPGPFLFALQPGQESQSTGNCTATQDQHIFALFPHMHQLGTHFKTELIIDGVTSSLHDEPYDFDEQAFKSFEPIAMSAGDKIRTTCTWFNTTGSTVTWGESSDSEMCFSIMYRYPAGDSDMCSN